MLNQKPNSSLFLSLSPLVAANEAKKKKEGKKVTIRDYVKLAESSVGKVC